MTHFLAQAVLFEEEHDHSAESTWQLVEENAAFVIIALAIMAAITVLSVIFERLYFKKLGIQRKGFDAKRIAGVGLLSAVGGVLTLLEIPLFVFYYLDFSEIPALIAGVLMGPVAGVIVEFIKVFVHILFHGTHSAFVGEFAMFVTGCLLMLPCSFIYWKSRTRKSLIIGLSVGIVSLIALGGIFNGFYLIPKFAELFTGQGPEAIVEMAKSINPNITNVWTLVLFATVPFNLIKGFATCIVVFLLYRPITLVYRKMEHS